MNKVKKTLAFKEDLEILSNSINEHISKSVNSEEGVNGIRYYNDELSYKDSDGNWNVIKTGGGGSSVPLPEPANTSVTNNDESVSLSWTDPDDVVIEGVTFATWSSTVVVRKEGTAPTDIKDGTIVVESTTKNQYSENGYVDSGLTNGITYYYGIFPKSTDGVCTTSKVLGITPENIYPSSATNLKVSTNKDNMSATVTFTLPDDATSAKVVMKSGSEPTSSNDGTVLTSESNTVTFNNLVLDTTYYFKVYTYNAKNRETVSDTSVNCIIKSLEIVTWSSGTDEQIAAMLEAHYNGDIDVGEYWSVGDTRTILLSSFSSGSKTHATQSIQMVIIDFKHDDLAESINGVSKAAITVNTKSLLGNAGAAESEYYWGSSHYPVADTENYSGSPLRTKLNTDFINAMPSTFASMIKSVVKKNFTTHTNSSMATTNTTDKAFLLSYPEVFGTATYTNYKGGSSVRDYEGTQYKYFETASNRVKYWNDDGVDSTTAFQYWLRSPSSYCSSTNGYFWCYVNSSGSAGNGSGNGTIGLALAFCL